MGCSGFLGQVLVRYLEAHGHTLVGVGRQVPHSLGVFQAYYSWDQNWQAECSQVGAIINLAGSPIAEGRWTNARKQQILNSRITTTTAVRHALEKDPGTVRVWLNASANGVYGHDFLGQVCQQWEQAAQLPESIGVRGVSLRTGLVLGPQGGLWPVLQTLYQWGLGGVLGSGQQWVPWIHWLDWVRAVAFLLDSPCHGPVDVVAPEGVNQKEFSKALGHALQRPAIWKTPAWLLQSVLGERSALLLSGYQATPRDLLHQGFEFQYGHLERALSQLRTP